MTLLSPLVLLIQDWLDKVNTRPYRALVLENIYPLIETHLQILDVGCDDGAFSSELMQHDSTLKVVGVDVQSHRRAIIPKAIYDGDHLPFPDGSFDLVMAIDVLHHTPDMLQVMREMARVSRRYLLIKDHLWKGSIINLWLIGLFDWLMNTPLGIGCAFNYPKAEVWEHSFSLLGLHQNLKKHISHLPFGVNRRFNCIFLLEKPGHRNLAL